MTPRLAVSVLAVFACSDSTGTVVPDATIDGDGGGLDGRVDGDGPLAACDWQLGGDGILMFEAEALPLVGAWMVGSDVAGYHGTGYIAWAGPSYNNQPGNGLLEVALGIPAAGRYRVQWRTRIGAGTNATEHNDVWLRFPDAKDSYGKAGAAPETRRYPKPNCEDSTFIAGIEALPDVAEARCANGATSDGWMKVYSSGATDWRWSTRTSDNDAHDIYVEFDAPGTYTMQLSARADLMLLDRIVVHREDVPSATAQDPGVTATPCP